MYDEGLYLLRAEACQVVAKHIIEDISDHEYLFQEVLLKRYSILRNGQKTTPANGLRNVSSRMGIRLIDFP